MRYVKPYGRSTTSKLKLYESHNRKLLENSGKAARTEFAELGQRLDFTIKHWISAIDKIAPKPKANKPANINLYDFREGVSQEAWHYIVEHQDFNHCPETLAQKSNEFFAKIHPYDKEPLSEKTKIYAYKSKKAAFGRFVPKDNVSDYAKIAENINHYVAQEDSAQTKQEHGLTPARVTLASIAKNRYKFADQPGTLAKRKLSELAATDINGYFKSDFAAEIYDKMETTTKDRLVALDKIKENIANKKRELVIVPDTNYGEVVAPILREHYKKIFVNNGTEIIGIARARQEKPDLFTLHETVKQYYKKLFDNHSIKPAFRDKKTLLVMPKDCDELEARLVSVQKNQDFAYLNRLGKVIYYQSLGNNLVKIPDIDAIKNSHYWNSDGQSEIKRNESLVRIWRLVTVYANHSLVQWGEYTGFDLQRDTGKNHQTSGRFRQKQKTA